MTCKHVWTRRIKVDGVVRVQRNECCLDLGHVFACTAASGEADIYPDHTAVVAGTVMGYGLAAVSLGSLGYAIATDPSEIASASVLLALSAWLVLFTRKMRRKRQHMDSSRLGATV